jgi:predicted amino acid dehydrogenase
LKRIISISPGSSQRDYRLTTTLLGTNIEIERFGSDGDTERAVRLVQTYASQGDMLSLEGVVPAFRTSSDILVQREVAHLAAHAGATPLVTGHRFKTLLERWCLKRMVEMVPGSLQGRRVLMVQGLASYPLAQALVQYEPRVRFADPLLQTGMLFAPCLRSIKQLQWYAGISPFLAAPWSQQPGNPPTPLLARMHRLFAWADVLIGDFETFHRFLPTDLRGRLLITDEPSSREIAQLREHRLATLVTMTPPLSQEHPFVSTSVLEAIARVVLSAQGKPADEAHLLDFISQAGWEPAVQQLDERRKKPSFAFVVHPLQVEHIFLHPRFRFARYLPRRLVEWVAAFLPPLYLSRIRGIRSQATGEEIEGMLLSLTATPREMLRRPPAFTYRRLLHAAHMAERRGAKLMGLGAFTSIVGDAGVTVAQQCSIGITTGNALTVATTLEAAKVAVQLMGGRVDEGCAVIIGATGSIGAACARLLAMAIGNVVLVAPRPERLLALKKQIEAETAGAHVLATTCADAYIGRADLIITTTSSLHGGVLDIEQLKPGAVICDVARPPNVLQAEADRRPDVLVIESGEVRLPGEPDFGFDIDLPPGTAYACLSETALLAMEGWFVDYTVGRTIQVERVKEMYRLMKKHGLELAGLRSFGKHISAEDIAEKRRLASIRGRE